MQKQRIATIVKQLGGADTVGFVMDVSRVSVQTWIREDVITPTQAIWFEALSGGKYKRHSMPIKDNGYGMAIEEELPRGALLDRAALIREKSERLAVYASLLSQLIDARTPA